MNKKILMSGAAALLLGSGLFAAPALANITFSHSGEATLSADFKDTCVTAASDLTENGNATDTAPATVSFLGLTYDYGDDAGGAGDSADEIEDAIDAITGGAADLPADLGMTANITFDDKYNCAAGVSMESPIWATTSKLEWSAGGTLANGLSVSTSKDADINLSGAFGSITFKSGGDSAVKATFAAGDGDITRAGEGFGGHALATSGTSGMVVTYAAPSMGGLDLNLSYAPNSAGTDYDNAAYTDTIGAGAKFSSDALTLSAGWESATANTAGDCDWNANLTGGFDGTTAISASALIDDIYGTDECGDQTLMAIGAAMSAGGLSIDAGYSDLDTEEADRSTTSIGISTSAGGWDLGLGWVTATRSSKIAGADTTQELIGASVSTVLGDGVSLGLKLSQNQWDDNSQATSRGGNGATNDFLAQAKLTITY